MSDIWHKAGFHEAIDDKLKVSKDGKWVYWTMYGWNIPGEDAHDIGCEWCYLDELLALETELERTRKALELAITGLKNCKTRDHIGAVCRTPEYVDKILEQIKTTLEQKD